MKKIYQWQQYFVVLFFCAICSSGLAQDSAVEDLLSRAKKSCFENIDSALFLANKALQRSESQQNKLLVAKSYAAIGIIYENNNRFSEAKNAYEKSLYHAELSKDQVYLLSIYTDWAIINKKMGNYKVAQAYHLKTIASANELQNWEMVEDGYHGLGTMYSMMSDFDEAVKAYLKSIEAAEKWQNKSGIVLTQQNISNVYLKSKNYPMARQNIQRTYEMAVALGDSIRIGAVLSIYGNIEAAMKNFGIALEKHQAAKIIFEKTNEKPRLAESLMSIGDIYFQEQKYELAEDYFKQCESLEQFLPLYGRANFYNKLGKFYQAEGKIDNAIQAFSKSLVTTDNIGFKEIARDNHYALSKVFAQKENYQQAYLHLDEANTIGESLFEEKNQKNLSEAQFRFDVQKLDLQIANQQKDLQQSLTIRYGLGIGLLLLSGLLFVTWRQMKAKQATSQRLALLMKELNHRVKNNLQTIVSLWRLQSRQISDPDSRKIIDVLRDRLEAIAALHQQFYQTDDIGKVNFDSFLEELVPKLANTYNWENDDFDTHIKIDNTMLNVENALPFALIINELITNSFKHGFENIVRPSISINIENNKLTYSDNGAGMPENMVTQKTTSFGLMLINSLSKQLKKQYTIKKSNGFYFEMY